jgi:short-subunit dehydrogenase
MTDLADKYGKWSIVAGGSDGVGASFAHQLAARGLNVAIVARRIPVLEAIADDIRTQHHVDVRVLPLDLSAPDGITQLADATSDLDVGLFVYNVGGDVRGGTFLERPIETHFDLVRRNCLSVLEAAYRFGAPMVERGRGALVLVTSGAAWAGSARTVAYGATKAFDLILAEGLWAEWHASGVDVLGLVLGATDTPSLHMVLQGHTLPFALADPDDVAREALDHLGDGPTWMYGYDDPTGASPSGAMRRRDAVLAATRGTSGIKA